MGQVMDTGTGKMTPLSLLFAAILSLLLVPLALATTLLSSCTTPPPVPVLPVPSERQLTWQRKEGAMFMHFGMNTFTNEEWGSGKEDPNLFNPPAIYASQWISAAKAGGFSAVILTTKHHDGFCLWPSLYTNHSVASSPWKQGKGDVVGEVASAAAAAGVRFGVYLSPWDRHDPSYTDIARYNEHYSAQLRELLSQYGEVSEMWFDGAKGDDRPMEYHTSMWFSVVRQLQPRAVIFSSIGPDVRYVGNEGGAGAPNTCWSPFNLSASIFDSSLMPSLAEGMPDGPDWAPPECDVSIRPGWFWHASEKPKPLSALLDIYFNTVGKNCFLLLNVPPSIHGIIEAEDVARLREFRAALDEMFAVDLVRLSKTIVGSSTRGNCATFRPSNVAEEGIDSFWAPSSGDSAPHLTITFASPVTFNMLLLQEPISFGQRIKKFVMHAVDKGERVLVANGTTVGYKKLEKFDPVTASEVHVSIPEWRGSEVLLARVGLFLSQAQVSNTMCSGQPCIRKPVIEVASHKQPHPKREVQ